MRFAREVALRFLGAVQFLTVVPVPFATVPYEEATPFFPLVGGMVGAFTGGILVLAVFAGAAFGVAVAPVGLAAAIAFAAGVLATGLLHEDGLADVADGVRSGRTPERILEIMRDSRIGTYGGVALVLSTLVRWQALVELAAAQPWFVIGVTTAAGVISRAAIVLLAASSRPAGSGMAASVVGRIPGWILLMAGLQASVAGSLAGWKGTAPLLLGSVGIVLLLRAWFHARIRGVSGDCLGATSVLVECYVLVVGACLKSF